MKSALFMPALVLVCALCAVTQAAPTARLTTDRAHDGAILAPGIWVDLLIDVDPAGSSVALAGLRATPAAEKVEFGAAILPPPDAGDAYTKPFSIRIPLQARADRKLPLTVRLEGVADGDQPFALDLETSIYADPQAFRHVVGSVRTSKPVTSGQPSALVVELDVAEGWHVYGEKVEVGLSMTAEALPSGPDPGWRATGGRVVPPGGKYHGKFSVELPFTALRAGEVEGRVALFWQACTDQECAQPEVAYLPFKLQVSEGQGVTAPTLRLANDRAADGAIVPLGRWTDLVLTVEPAAPLAPGALSVAGDGAEFGEPIFPPTGPTGSYDAPFTVRVPIRPTADGKQVVGLTLAGPGFEARAETKIYAVPEAGNHLSGAVRLRDPAAGPGAPNALVVDLRLLSGYHVYGSAVEVGIPMSVTLLPAGPESAWEGGGTVTPPGDKLEGEFSIEIPFTPATASVRGRVGLFWYACTDQICDQPEVGYLPFELELAGKPGTRAAVRSLVTGDSGADDLGKKSLWALLLASIGGGLFALVMPCTYPLIPITISFFTKQAEAREGKVVGLALAYGAGIVAIFAGIGLLVGFSTVSADSVLDFANNPWVNGLFALLFLVFGLSLIGLFQIRLPSFFDNIAAKASGQGGYLSVFAMGTTLVITSFTCTAPFIGTLLLWAARSGEVGVTTACMAVFGLTMAIPFVFLSLSPNAMKKLPRSGEWMEQVKVTLGIIELGLVLKFLSIIDVSLGNFWLDRETFLWLWALSFLAAGLYLSGFFRLFRASRGRAIVATGMVALTLYLLGGLGAPLNVAVLEGFLPPEAPDAVADSGVQRYDEAFLAVVKEDYEAGLATATSKKAPVFLHFTGFN